MASSPNAAPSDVRTRRGPDPGKWIAAFLALLVALSAGGVWLHYSFIGRIRDDWHRQLSAIGRLKARWVSDWRGNCLQQAGKLAGSPFFTEAVLAFVNDPESQDMRARLLGRLDYERRYLGCEAIEVRAPDGRLLLGTGSVGKSSGVEEAVMQAVAGKGPVLSPLVRDPEGNIRITAAAPVKDSDGAPVAVIAILTDPGRELYPLLTEWPGGSDTAETLLVERRGDDVIFLNNIRHLPDAALTKRIPLTETNVVAVQAATGLTGQFVGTDYRGVEVVSDLRAVPDSPWLMVAKVDSTEAYADFHATMKLAILLLLSMAAAGAAVLYALYRGGQAKLLLRLDEEHDAHEAGLRRLNAELEDRVNHRTAQLALSNRELEAFAYSVSHDLRAPLRAIEGFASILVEEYGPKLDDEARRLLGVVRANTEKMDRLIHGILELSRIARAQIVPTDVDMTALARAAWQEAVPGEERATFEFLLPELPPARGDALLLRQVWANLLSNAAKYTSRSEVRRIEVGSFAEDGLTWYFVKDSGAGFDPAYAAKLFGVFQRLHKESEFEGLGIGLANAQRIIGRHGGQIRAESSPGKGASFFFSIPGKVTSVSDEYEH